MGRPVLSAQRTKVNASRTLQKYLKWAGDRRSPHWVFRGQSQPWPIKPLVGRTDLYSTDRELALLSEFKRLCRPYLNGSPPRNNWDWLFIAQHHGLPTRLVDWTTNPLVAAFFAVQPSAREKKDGQVVALKVQDIPKANIDDPKQDPFAIEKNYIVYPSALATRITTQRGLFSIHPEPKKAWKVKNDEDSFTFSASEKHELQRLLHGIGLDKHFLMGDLDGLCNTLNWSFANGIAFA